MLPTVGCFCFRVTYRRALPLSFTHRKLLLFQGHTEKILQVIVLPTERCFCFNVTSFVYKLPRKPYLFEFTHKRWFLSKSTHRTAERAWGFLSFFLGFLRPNLITGLSASGLSRWRAPGPRLPICEISLEFFRNFSSCCVTQTRGFSQGPRRTNLAGWFLKQKLPWGTILKFSHHRRHLLVEVRRGAGTRDAPCILDHHCSSASL